MPHMLLVMAKAPVAGQVKTRLCPPLDEATAAGLAACFLEDTLAMIRQVPAVTCGMGYTPAAAEGYFRALAPEMVLFAQRGPDLGERLAQLFLDGFAAGATAVVIIGSDIPDLPPTYLARAFAALTGPADLVLGPSDDGGYYLIGLKQPHLRLVREVTMSTPTVLRDTVAIAEELGLGYELLPTWYDIDTIDDLAHLRQRLATADAATCVATRRFIAQLRWDAVLGR